MPPDVSGYRLSPLAESDLEDIWLYTLEQWSRTQADSYISDIIAAIDKLSSGERKGRVCDIRDGYLKYAVGRHIIFFRQLNTDLDVMRILHQSMDIERHLK